MRIFEHIKNTDTMKTREEILAYVNKLQNALLKEQQAYKTKDSHSSRVLSLDLQDRLEAQINALIWVLKDD